MGGKGEAWDLFRIVYEFLATQGFEIFGVCLVYYIILYYIILYYILCILYYKDERLQVWNVGSGA